MNMMFYRAYQAAYDMFGANEAIVKHEMRSAQELPMANTALDTSVLKTRDPAESSHLSGR
jgi:hypothetical protein